MNPKRYVFTTPSDTGLKMAANHYKPPPSTTENIFGLTLLLAHCIGSHKEQWEPLIEHLFRLQETKDEIHRIREIWAFDWQSHGDSAVLNRLALNDCPNDVCSAAEWTLAITAFLRSSHVRGHRIVAIGHSAGATAIMLTTKEPLYYCAMILIEPTMMTREVFNAHYEDRMASMDFAVAATSSRRDTWNSRSDAFKYFMERVPWKFWNPSVLRILTEYGLEESPSGLVALKCHRKLEAASYTDVEPHFEGAIQFGRICNSVPVHVIWGTRDDLVPEFIQDSLIEGRFTASITRIQDAGHMLVQEKSEHLAQVISDILDTLNHHGEAQFAKL